MLSTMNQDTLGDLLKHQKSLEEEASHHAHLDACESKNPHETPDIHQKSSEINDLENEPGHVWRFLGYQETSNGIL